MEKILPFFIFAIGLSSFLEIFWFHNLVVDVIFFSSLVCIPGAWWRDKMVKEGKYEIVEYYNPLTSYDHYGTSEMSVYPYKERIITMIAVLIFFIFAFCGYLERFG